MKRIALLLITLFAIGLAGSSAAVAGSHTKNQTGYWEAKGYGVCTKASPDGQVFKMPAPPTDRVWSLLVIKAGSFKSTLNPRIVIKDPTPGKTYGPVIGNDQSPKAISHIIKCSKVKKTPRTPTDPTARLIGPCGDPFYRAVFDNRSNTKGQTFVWRFIGRDGVEKVKRTLKPGQTYKSSWRFVTGSTRSWVYAPDHGKLVDRTVAAPGFYKPCWRGYTVGFSGFTPS